MRPPAVLLAAALALAALGGCSSFSPREAFSGRDVGVVHQPPRGSAEFQRLALERTPSIVVLKIEGDDTRSNMEIISQVLLAKGYSVRDFHVTLEELTKAGLLARAPLDPEAIERASRLFTEAAAVAGSLEVLQLEPLRAQLSLAWIDLKTRKVLWTAKATYSGYTFGGRDRFEAAIRDMVEQALAPLPPAKP
ncbi:MAG: hypothetical protein A3J27_13715 [Candidatus Tectomicrobia bacterium RIFCSPLOWO2_12_FULL_69_37]|nr:MAG: hypothetical protein A3I72_13090 [Candidatus Tectomicrobia bacterium RIFCSPLOWO2_02_FULL_70_19]OGL68386.1 MAG: hypothetical protein A3J27_13715 [Candidatus Tectomicrobia bacterium RIFCSPLOWO2_12_FULL_69_37]